MKKKPKKPPLKLVEYADLSPNERKELYKLYEEDLSEYRKKSKNGINIKRR
jgi:hypothetical protein